ncbi:MAG TPA: hypothetical protein PKD60_12190, partial [Turneriella sp.]|nr:hypothetical protein [Turneriella sp.]
MPAKKSRLLTPGRDQAYALRSLELPLILAFYPVPNTASSQAEEYSIEKDTAFHVTEDHEFFSATQVAQRRP